MHGHSDEEHRSLRIDGTKATLHARFGRPSEIRIFDHGGGEERVPIPESSTGHGGGHGGGDDGIMRDFVRVLRREAPPQTPARASLESHLLAFAAEEARLHRTVVEMSEFRARAESLAD
jgi:predicted dehydrogenase